MLENAPAVHHLPRSLPVPGVDETLPSANDTSAKMVSGQDAVHCAMNTTDMVASKKQSSVKNDGREGNVTKEPGLSSVNKPDKKRKSNVKKKKRSSPKKNRPIATSTSSAAFAAPKTASPTSKTRHADPRGRSTPAMPPKSASSTPVVIANVGGGRGGRGDDDDDDEAEDDDVPISVTDRKKASPANTPERAKALQNHNRRSPTKKSPSPKPAFKSKKKRSPVVTQASKPTVGVAPTTTLSKSRKLKARKLSNAVAASPSPAPANTSPPCRQAPSPATTETDEPPRVLPQESVAVCKKKITSRKQPVSFAENVQAASKTSSSDAIAATTTTTSTPGEKPDEQMPDSTASSSPLLPRPYQSIDEISRNPITRARKRLGSVPVTSRKNAPPICDKPGVPGPNAYY